MSTHNQFTPAASTTFTAMGMAPTPIVLPAVDANNPAVLLQNVGPGAVYVFAGGSAGGSIAGAPGVVVLHENESRMLPTHAGFGGSTMATMQSAAGGGRLQVTRGAVTGVWLFPAPAVTVI